MMQKIQQATGVTISFGALGQGHGSTAPASPGQIKQLGLLALGAIPSDMPKGFAEWFADGTYKLAVKELITENLKYWRSRYFEIKSATQNRVPSNPGGTLAEYFRRQGQVGKPLMHEQSIKVPWSVWESKYPKKKAQQGFYYHVSTVDRSLLGRMLGENQGLASEWALTPLQVYDIVKEDRITYEGRDYLFFLGFYQGTFPLFMRVWYHNEFWRLRDVKFNDPREGAENVHLVISKELPK